MLIDPFQRPVTNLRVSVTPRCNLRCIYCHREGEEKPRGEMSAEEIAEVLQVAAGCGMRSVKLTGGEPMLRRDLCDIIASVPQGMDASMTTNATLLAERAADLAEAGLSRVNVSLDSLQPERYQQITGKDLLERVLAGIDAAVEAGLTPVKLNMVLIECVNEDEVPAFLSYVRNNRDLILQLIELMDWNGCTLHGNIDGVEHEISTHAKEIITRRMHHRKKYCLDGAEVEVVRPLHNTEFCAFCNRLRVTSDGMLKPCLLRKDNHVDIRGKHGEELAACFKEAVARRAPYFR